MFYGLKYLDEIEGLGGSGGCQVRKSGLALCTSELWLVYIGFRGLGFRDEGLEFRVPDHPEP